MSPSEPGGRTTFHGVVLPQPGGEFVAAIEAIVGKLPTYGYRRVDAVMRRKAHATAVQGNPASSE